LFEPQHEAPALRGPFRWSPLFPAWYDWPGGCSGTQEGVLSEVSVRTPVPCEGILLLEVKGFGPTHEEIRHHHRVGLRVSVYAAHCPARAGDEGLQRNPSLGCGCDDTPYRPPQGHHSFGGAVQRPRRRGAVDGSEAPGERDSDPWYLLRHAGTRPASRRQGGERFQGGVRANPCASSGEYPLRWPFRRAYGVDEPLGPGGGTAGECRNHCTERVRNSRRVCPS
jgi:hypothetical protein